MTPDVSKNFGSEVELANGLAIPTGLLGCSRGSEFDVLHAKGVESLCDGYFGLCIEESIRELLAFWNNDEIGKDQRKPEMDRKSEGRASQGALDDVKVGYVAQEVRSTGSIGIPPLLLTWAPAATSMPIGTRVPIYFLRAGQRNGDHFDWIDLRRRITVLVWAHIENGGVVMMELRLATKDLLKQCPAQLRVTATFGRNRIKVTCFKSLSSRISSHRVHLRKSCHRMAYHNADTCTCPSIRKQNISAVGALTVGLLLPSGSWAHAMEDGISPLWNQSSSVIQHHRPLTDSSMRVARFLRYSKAVRTFIVDFFFTPTPPLLSEMICLARPLAYFPPPSSSSSSPRNEVVGSA